MKKLINTFLVLEIVGLIVTLIIYYFGYINIAPFLQRIRFFALGLFLLFPFLSVVTLVVGTASLFKKEINQTDILKSVGLIILSLIGILLLAVLILGRS